MRPHDDIRDPTKPRYHRRTMPGVIKAFEDEEGIIEGYASVAGVLDSYKEIVDKGAFERTLKELEGRIAFCWQHDWHEVIGLLEEIEERPRSKLPKDLQEQFPEATAGLWFRAKVLDTRQGSDAKILLRAKAIKEMSIGFDLYEDGHYKDDDDIVHLRHIVLYEISPVTMGAQPAAQIVGYKGDIPAPPKLDGAHTYLGEKMYAYNEAGWWVTDRSSWETDTMPKWESIEECDIPYGKPEETEDFVRIPNPGVGDCEVTATITISESEGITALYCGETKEVRTFIFAKAKGWTMAKAQKWVDDHKDEFKTAVISLKDFGKEFGKRLVRHLDREIMIENVIGLLLDNQLEEGYTLLRELVSELPQPTLGEAEELALRASILEAETEAL